MPLMPCMVNEDLTLKADTLCDFRPRKSLSTSAELIERKKKKSLLRKKNESAKQKKLKRRPERCLFIFVHSACSAAFLDLN